MTEPRRLAVVRSYTEMVEALRARCDELQIPHAVVDAIAGLQDGYTSKVLSPKPFNGKGLGPVSWGILEVLGLRVMLVEDWAGLQRMIRRPDWRERRHARSASITASIAPTMGWITAENAGYLAKRRAEKLAPNRRAKIARKAAKARWSKKAI